MRAARTLAAVLLVVAAGDARAQQNPFGVGPQQRLVILDLEDRRASDLDLAQYLPGAELLPPDHQRFLVRMLGRLERPSLIPQILPFLVSREAAVRVEAAGALAQALHVEKPEHDAVQNVQRLLLAKLQTERAAGAAGDQVRGAIARSLGRLPYDTPQMVQNAQAAILDVLKPSIGKPDIAAASIAFESLFRLHRRLEPPSEEAVRALKLIVMSHTMETAGLRNLAMAALLAAAAVDEDVIERALGDFVDEEVETRRLAAAAIRAVAPARLDLIDVAMRDTKQGVRLEALHSYGANPIEGCGRMIDALLDRSDHVALLAIDLLGGPCASDQNVGEILGGFTGNVPQLRDWHRAAHAIVAMAKRDPGRAVDAMPAFVSHSAWQVRMYAARAAAVLKDVDLLKRFADDEHDNVREAAIAGLNPIVRHDADDLYLANLGRADYQLLITVASVLQGTPKREAAAAALFDALARITAQKKDTSRDVRLALLERLREVGDPGGALNLKAYFADFDPQVAIEAADLFAVWTGARPEIAPQPLPRTPLPAIAELSALRGRCARVTMRWAGQFCLVFRLDEAPLTSIRIARLVASKYYDGLTFHRVVPNFVLQGGSPGANEYAGADPYMRDEIGPSSHGRLTAGISTRGRDTGDAQIFINLANNLRLDNEYTAFASVLELNADAIDRILEGDTMVKVEIVPTPRK